ncbi:Tex-like N-terminal domain-containing protein, partial [Dysgonomonas sp. 511]|uniref:Tex-like N-terminal domain-containing protein n=1 Tax=Dysgonomonas sp. 511 TaxID=2302930 RepID=UPI00271536A2
NTFEEIKKINVAINLHRLELDRYGNIWVSSELEDIYLPYKPKRQTRAEIARYHRFAEEKTILKTILKIGTKYFLTVTKSLFKFYSKSSTLSSTDAFGFS